MQFVTHGPDIPDALLQAHEEGRVVFFCGAGISYPAGLPGFKGLVEQIYQLNGTSLSDIEREAFERGQFDATLSTRPAWEWDVAAGALIAAQAGCVVSDLAGQPMRFNSPRALTEGLVVAAPALHDALLAAMTPFTGSAG